MDKRSGSMLHSTSMPSCVPPTSLLFLSSHPLEPSFLFIHPSFIAMSVTNTFSSTWADCGEAVER
ncbi:hypothetical protein JOQ06_026387, partial [Pogonophryne albipinna]